MTYQEIYNNLFHEKAPKFSGVSDSRKTLVIGMCNNNSIKNFLDKFVRTNTHVVVIGHYSDLNLELPKLDSILDVSISGLGVIDDSEFVRSLPTKDSAPQYRKFYAFNRMNKMTALRNWINSMIREVKPYYDRYILVDTDVEFYKESVDSILSHNKDDKTIYTALGIIIKNYSNVEGNIKSESFNSIIYNDVIAYRDLTDDRYLPIHDNLNCHLHSILGGVIRDVVKSKTHVVEVNSAFGSMASYPIECCDQNYTLTKNSNENSNVEYECEHVSFNYDLIKLGYKIVIDGSVIGVYHV